VRPARRRFEQTSTRRWTKFRILDPRVRERSVRSRTADPLSSLPSNWPHPESILNAICGASEDGVSGWDRRRRGAHETLDDGHGRSTRRASDAGIDPPPLVSWGAASGGTTPLSEAKKPGTTQRFHAARTLHTGAQAARRPSPGTARNGADILFHLYAREPCREDHRRPSTSPICGGGLRCAIPPHAAELLEVSASLSALLHRLMIHISKS
jgi:hypothetical protein